MVLYFLTNEYLEPQILRTRQQRSPLWTKHKHNSCRISGGFLPPKVLGLTHTAHCSRGLDWVRFAYPVDIGIFISCPIEHALDFTCSKLWVNGLISNEPHTTLVPPIPQNIKLIEAGWRIYASVNLPSLVQIMACRLVGAKPLSEPMLGYC